MSRLSALSAPERMLISVDLPAPLSPSRPRISFRRTDKVTSLSACTRPKNLLMCSIRTSSSAIALSPRMVPAFKPGMKRHHAQDNRADENIVGKARHANQDDAVTHHAQDQHTEDCTDDRALTASEPGTADYPHSPTLQLVLSATVRVGR